MSAIDLTLNAYYVGKCHQCNANRKYVECWYDHLTHKWLLSCGKCNADSDWHPTKQLAVNGWNAPGSPTSTN